MSFQNQVEAPRLNYEPYIQRRTTYSRQQKEDAVARLNQGIPIPLRLIRQLAGPKCSRSTLYRWRDEQIKQQQHVAAQRRQQEVIAAARQRQQLETQFAQVFGFIFALLTILGLLLFLIVYIYAIYQVFYYAHQMRDSLNRQLMLRKDIDFMKVKFNIVSNNN